MKQRFTDEKIVSILRVADTGAQTVAEVCRQYGISVPTLYAWRRRFGTMPEREVKRLRELEKENARLKRLLAERAVEVDVLQELLQKK